MASLGRRPPRVPPSHRKTGAQLGYNDNVIIMTVHCEACESVQTEPMLAEASIKRSLAGITCLFCGRLGAMRMGRGS